MKTLSFPRNLQIPSGKTATLAEMKDYGAAIQSFVRSTEQQLKHERNTRRHNDAVEYLNHIAKHYNNELKLFKEKEQNKVMLQVRDTMGLRSI